MPNEARLAVQSTLTKQIAAASMLRLMLGQALCWVVQQADIHIKTNTRQAAHIRVHLPQLMAMQRRPLQKSTSQPKMSVRFADQQQGCGGHRSSDNGHSWEHDHENDPSLFHPLDWASYLRRSLVTAPVPCILTLLIVTAHYGACSCIPSHPPVAAAGAQTLESGREPFSFLGTVFSATSLLSSCISANGIERLGRVRTPFHAMKNMDARSGETRTASDNKLHQERHTFSDDEGTTNIRDPPMPLPHQPLILATEGMLGSSLFSDPFTAVYDAWNAHFIAVDATQQTQHQEYEEGTAQNQGSQQPKNHPPNTPIHEEPEACSGGNIHGEASGSATSAEEAWGHVCAMHVIGASGVGAALLPSLLCSRGRLACNTAIPRVRASAWPIFNSCMGIFGVSFLACCALMHVTGLNDLAMCMCMHTVARIIAAYVEVVQSCPLPPVFMQGAAASGMGIAMGMLVLYVGHIEVGAEDFYMNHAWACWVAVLLVRHTVLRGASWFMCAMQARVVARVVDSM